MINDGVKITETHITRDVGSLNRFDPETVKDNVDQFEVWKFGSATMEDLTIQSILNHLENYIPLVSNSFLKGFQ